MAQKHGPAGTPAVDPLVADALEEMLQTEHPSPKPPRKMAAVLAYTIELYWLEKPFPSRQAAADAAGCSIHMVDAALSQLISRGYLSQSVATPPGKVQQREGIVRHRFYVPAKRVRTLVERVLGRR